VDQPRGHILLFTILINLQSLLKVYIDLKDIEDKDKFKLCRFRTTNHRLPVEVGRWKKNLLEKAGSVIYVQEENWETSITIFLNVLNLLMKENFILILSI
jgi:hypothetical protein